MKKIFFALIIIVAVFAACKKNNNDNPSPITTAAVNSTITSGSWKVTLFNNSGTDETSNFNGFNFTFATSGTVDAANSLFAVNGTWKTDVDNNKVKLFMNYPTPSVSAFLDLSEDWEVTGRTDVKVTMQHLNSGGAGSDYLTIEKN